MKLGDYNIACDIYITDRPYLSVWVDFFLRWSIMMTN